MSNQANTSNWGDNPHSNLSPACAECDILYLEKIKLEN